MKIQELLWLLLLPLGGISAQASLFEGSTPGGPGSVLVLGALPERPPALQGILLLPLEGVGRTHLTELLDGQLRLRTDVPGAARLLLPGEQGSLYKYRRDDAAGRVYGYMLVGPDGIARSVFEQPAAGPPGVDDPLPGRVAVAADGRAALVSTSPAAGGDLWELDLVAGTSINRTPDLPPQAFQRNGLVLLAGWGLGVSESGVYRFERQPAARAGAVSVPSSPSWFGPDVVRSADDSTVAFLAGESVTRARVYTCRSAGDAQQATDRAMHIRGAGFLPEDPTGPTLALSTDGSWVAWRREGSSSREVFVRATQPGGRPSDFQVTGDANFEDTLNDSGVIAFFDPDSAVLVVGKDASDGIRRADLFRMDLSPAGVSASNLSGTSGISRPPFDYGSLDTSDGLYQIPGTSTFLSHRDADAGRGKLLRVGVDGSVSVLLDPVASLDFVELAGTHLVAGVTRPAGVDDPLVARMSLAQIERLGGAPVTLALLPDGTHLGRIVGSRSRNIFAGIMDFPAGEWLGRAHVPTTNGLTLTQAFARFGPTTGAMQDGSILASVQLAGGQTTFAWMDVGAQVLRSGPGASFLLPGL